MTNRYYEDVPKIDYYLVNPDEIESTYEIVLRILDVEAPTAGLQHSDIIADITGGTKTMAIGVALACMAREQDMQYMRTLRDINGAPVSWPVAEPIKIDATLAHKLARKNDVEVVS